MRACILFIVFQALKYFLTQPWDNIFLRSKAGRASIHPEADSALLITDAEHSIQLKQKELATSIWNSIYYSKICQLIISHMKCLKYILLTHNLTHIGSLPRYMRL